MTKHGEAKEKLLRLYELYEQPMYRIAYAILHHTEQAEDVVSDAFLILLKNLKKIDKPESEQTKRYVVQIVRRTAINQYRKNERESKRTAAWDESVLQIPDASNDVETLLNGTAQREVLAALLNDISDTDRRIILLRCQEELSFQEIAEKISMKESTVRKRFERARKAIMKRKGVTYYEIQQFSL